MMTRGEWRLVCDNNVVDWSRDGFRRCRFERKDPTGRRTWGGEREVNEKQSKCVCRSG